MTSPGPQNWTPLDSNIVSINNLQSDPDPQMGFPKVVQDLGSIYFEILKQTLMRIWRWETGGNGSVWMVFESFFEGVGDHWRWRRHPFRLCHTYYSTLEIFEWVNEWMERGTIRSCGSGWFMFSYLSPWLPNTLGTHSPSHRCWN